MKLSQIWVSALTLSLLLFGHPAAAQEVIDPNDPTNFPIPQNVRVENGILKWDPVENAGGYNIYYTPDTDLAPHAYPTDYFTTVKGSTGATLFSRHFQSGAKVSYLDGKPGEENSEKDNAANAPSVKIFSVTCGNVNAGDSCIARCNGEADNQAYQATGGACATSDAVESDATAEARSYHCTVPEFSSEVRAQVYCLK